jgi:hypothetical protein
MRLSVRGVLTVCAVGSLALPGFGQVSVSSLGTGSSARQPYTAQFKITSERTLANGTTITHESTELDAVDVEGRHLTVTTNPATGEMPERTVYHVFDPVARTNATWSVPGKVADVTNMAPPLQPGQRRESCVTTSTAAVSASAGRTDGISVVAGGIGGGSTAPTVQTRTANQESTRENLGTQEIQGVLAKGTRTTSTTPAGAVGNDAPLVRTSEIWVAQSPRIIVREMTDDPQSGKRTKELVELRQEGPDPASFQPPEGYEIRTSEVHLSSCEH